MTTLATLDLAVAALLALMAGRGFFIGGVREACSLASLAGALLLVWLFARPLGAWLASLAPIGIAPWLTVMLAGALLGIASLTLLGFAGRRLRDWLRSNNLGFFDRGMGALLGAAECALLVMVALRIVINVLGADVGFLRGTYTLALYEQTAPWFDAQRASLTAAARGETRAAGANAVTALAEKARAALPDTPEQWAAREWLCETPRAKLVEKFGEPAFWEKSWAAYQRWCGVGGGGDADGDGDDGAVGGDGDGGADGDGDDGDGGSTHRP